MSREKEETMKKLALCLALVMILLSFVSCTEDITDTSAENVTVTQGLSDVTAPISLDDEEGTLRVFGWVSYFELKVTSDRQTQTAYRDYIVTLFEKMHSADVTDALIHVRAYSDAFYRSDVFPASENIKVGGEVKFDPLTVVIDVAKSYGISVHAWINPYRVGDITSRPGEDTIRQWYEEDNGNVFAVGESCYLNPSREEVQRLVIDGARELMEKYDLAGIHIDDYFYPRDCGNFDEADYSRYKKEGGALGLGDYRRENVSSLISGLYCAVKTYGEDKLFTVSPTGDIEKAFTEDYADVYCWLGSEGYADYIMPQLYYGFDHSTMPFEACLDTWLSADAYGKILPGLACYKQGQEDAYAGEGRDEWTQDKDIISRQGAMAVAKGCGGYALYSASYINFS